jgi:hypothetical protein
VSSERRRHKKVDLLRDESFVDANNGKRAHLEGLPLRLVPSLKRWTVTALTLTQSLFEEVLAREPELNACATRILLDAHS